VRRLVAPLSLLLVFAGLAAGRSPLTGAQAGTPAAGTPAGGDTPPFVALAVSETLPGQVVVLTRTISPPGPEGVLAPHVHPAPFIAFVESGTLGFVLHRGRATIARAGGGTPVPDAPAEGEPLPLGTEVLAGPGDWLFIDGGAVIGERAAGDAPLVTLVAAAGPADEPPVILTNEEGTPVPGTPAP